MERTPDIVLVRPQHPGNVGACARAMANMGLSRLVLVDAPTPPGPEARARAVGALHVLEEARSVAEPETALAPYSRVVGTTSGRGRTLGIPQLTPRQLPALLAGDPPETPTALLFGPEASGLQREELARCSALVRVPASRQQPTLNLAQAVLILAYELRLAGHREDPGERDSIASSAQIDALLSQAEPLLREIGFARDDSYRGVATDLGNLLRRATPSSREIRILRGICRRAAGRLRLSGPGDKLPAP